MKVKKDAVEQLREIAAKVGLVMTGSRMDHYYYFNRKDEHHVLMSTICFSHAKYFMIGYLTAIGKIDLWIKS